MVQPPPPPQSPATEKFYGIEVVDPYRGFEQLAPATIDWIKRQGAFTRSLLDSIPARAALATRIATFDSQFPAVDKYQSAGSRQFFRRRDAGADDFDLFVRDASGVRKLVDVNVLRARDHGTPHSIDFFLASPDGSKVAVGISRNGSEDASLRIYDAATGAAISKTVDRVQLGMLAWSDDGTRLYMNRLKPSMEGAFDHYVDSTVDVWDLQSVPQTALGRSVLNKAGLRPTDTPQFILSPTSPVAALRLENGAEQNIAVWTIPKAQLASQAAWKPLVSHRDGVTAVELGGSKIFLLSNAQAPNFKVLVLDARAPLASARTVLPTDTGRVLESLHAASDGLYVVARHGLYSQLLKIDTHGAVTEIPLPGKGHIGEAFSRADHPGVTIGFESWTRPSRFYAFDPAANRFAGLDLAPRPNTAFDDVQVRDLEAPAAGGVKVPLTLIDAGKARSPILLQAYGSYGISMLPRFTPVMMAFIREGGTYAVCHARGGGELGDAWRLAGKDANKPNTWGDLIACAEYLHAGKFAVGNPLFIYGRSGGGIAVGRAVTDRPDLFAGVLDVVPPPNMLRLESMPEGALETQEFGSIKTESGFRNLLTMDTYQHVRDGEHYPPILISMGLNDARIAPWQSAKLMARLLAAGDKTALLRVDVDDGHGVSSNRLQSDTMFTDFFSFVFWHAGWKGWSPARP